MNERHGSDESQRNTVQQATCSLITETTLGGNNIEVADFENDEDVEDVVDLETEVMEATLKALKSRRPLNFN